ncbi:vitellogenin-2-like [Stomoxys calcitrans]|uniref:vitellogenin-2-like n=1 Tax=Stomoxys calcitrans TaxID=35570 RepID=UPI0027E278CA|nr:vitellogenin-2-like [Stomoxys calcitrans]
MNPLRTICLMMGVLALACAGSSGPRPMGMHYSRNSIKNSMKPTNWMSMSVLQSLPSLKDIKLRDLESMSTVEGAELMHRLYHLAQASQALEPSFAPKPSEIPAFLITPDNQKIDFKLSELPTIAKQYPHFGEQEVTAFITGLPSKFECVKDATRKIVQAYQQRYNRDSESSVHSYAAYDNEKRQRNNEEDKYSASASSYAKNYSNKPTGCLIVINFGDTISDFEQYVTLDSEKVGKDIGHILAKVLEENGDMQDNFHLIGSNAGANIAGAAGRQYTHETSHQLRRITGLDPVKTFAKNPEELTGLARGDAEFVDIIHTTANSMGTATRSGNVDFFPNGPNEAVEGADNIIDSSMLAVRYFAESVVPGNERNFPAVGAESIEEYKSQSGNGRHLYMGINTPFDAEGDYMLQVNTKSPYGRSTPAPKQKNQRHHNSFISHKSWKMTSQDYE